MRLHPPFLISARLAPALRVGDATLSLIDVRDNATPDGRDVAVFALDFDDGTSYEDDNLKSGCGGFRGYVEIFESFLGYMGACAESMQCRTRYETRGENADLFPPHIAEWCEMWKDEIDMSRCDLLDPETDRVLSNLIEEY